MTRGFQFALALVILGRAIVEAQETNSDVSRHFLAAREAQASGNLQLAAQEYLAVVRLEPKLAEAQMNLGLVFYLQARYDESAQAIEKALSSKPGLRGADLFLGMDYVKLGQSRRAVPGLKRAVEREPANKQATTWLSTALWDAGQENEAIAELRSAQRSFPADPDILFLLGQAYRNAGNEEMERTLAVVGTPLYHQAYGDIYRDQQAWTKALQHYHRALDKDPKWGGAHLGLGNVYFRQGSLEKARSEFSAERGSGSIAATATARLAEIALLQGRAEEALSLLNEAIQTDSDAAADSFHLPPLPFGGDEQIGEEARSGYQKSADALRKMSLSPARSLALAAVDLRLGLRDALAREWARYCATKPSPAPVSDNLARARRQFDRHDFDGAQSNLRAFLAAHPQDAQARYLLAKTEHALSLSVLADMLAAAPDSPRTHQLMGQSMAARDDNDEALTEFRKVTAAAPELGGVHFAIGELLWKKNQTDQAMAEFQQELRVNPASAEANAAVGTILVRTHRTDQAIPYLQRALQLKPGLLPAHQELGKAFYERHDLARAERELRIAIANDPEGSAHYLLGNVYKETGQGGQARAAFAESRRIKIERLSAVNAALADKTEEEP